MKHQRQSFLPLPNCLKEFTVVDIFESLPIAKDGINYIVINTNRF